MSTVTVTKHPAPRAAGNKADLYVSAGTPFVSAVKKVVKLHTRIATQRQKRRHVTVYSTGKAIPKALSIGAKFQADGHQVEVDTGTVNVTDEHDTGDPDQEPQLKRRSVSKVEVRIYTKAK